MTAKFVEEHGAHPRSRGDHDTRTTPGKHLRGSSPLARGPHFGALFPPAEWGLIPARAGTTAKRTWDRKNARAHPRSRGDHRRRPVRRPACRGSSPLARGPRVASLSPRASRGLIPARAGTTGGRLVRPCRLGAHPRSRGDHCDSGCRCNSEQGSSPLARGPRSSVAIATVNDGLIPARAGTTERPAVGFAGARAHPRSRGDHR